MNTVTQYIEHPEIRDEEIELNAMLAQVENSRKETQEMKQELIRLAEQREALLAGGSSPTKIGVEVAGIDGGREILRSRIAAGEDATDELVKKANRKASQIFNLLLNKPLVSLRAEILPVAAFLDDLAFRIVKKDLFGDKPASFTEAPAFEAAMARPYKWLQRLLERPPLGPDQDKCAQHLSAYLRFISTHAAEIDASVEALRALNARTEEGIRAIQLPDLADIEDESRWG